MDVYMSFPCLLDAHADGAPLLHPNSTSTAPRPPKTARIRSPFAMAYCLVNDPDMIRSPGWRPWPKLASFRASQTTELIGGSQHFRAERTLLARAVDEDLDLDGRGVDFVGERNEISRDERALLRVPGERKRQVRVEDPALLHDLDRGRDRIDGDASRFGGRAAVERRPQPDAELVLEARSHQIVEAEHGWRGDVSGVDQVTQTGLVNSLLNLHGPGGQADLPADVGVALRLAPSQQLELNGVALVERESAREMLGKRGVLLQGGENRLGGFGDVVRHASSPPALPRGKRSTALALRLRYGRVHTNAPHRHCRSA